MKHEDPFDDRLAAAFSDGATSSSVAALIEEAEAAAQAVNEIADRARARAMEPTLSAKELADARREMEDAAFKRDRLTVARARLNARLTELCAVEENARRRAAYDEAARARDQLADELVKVYPKLVAQLADLLERLRASDARIEQVNATPPSGLPPLLVAELKARGLDGFVRGFASDVPRLTRATRLPAFTFDQHAPYAWPPPAGSTFDVGNL